MKKKEVRDFFLKQRSLLSDLEVEEKSKQIFTLWKDSDLSKFNSFHIFLPIKKNKEVNTLLFIEYLWKNNKNIFCPKVENDLLTHYELNPNTPLKENKWGIPEPSSGKKINLSKIKIECILIPLLACDKNGNRVGYGKGYYDKFLTFLPNATKIGVSFFPPIKKLEDVSTMDIPLEYLITSEEILHFR